MLNFIKGKIGDDLISFSVGDIQIPVAQKHQSLATDKLKSAETYGIRPENIKINSKDISSGLAAEVVVVEPLGSREIVILKIEDIELTADIESTGDLKSGMKVNIEIDSDHSHLFDNQGNNLL